MTEVFDTQEIERARLRDEAEAALRTVLAKSADSLHKTREKGADGVSRRSLWNVSPCAIRASMPRMGHPYQHDVQTGRWRNDDRLIDVDFYY